MSNKEQGFTLIELLVCMFIFSLVGLSFVQSSITTFKNLDLTNRHDAMQQLALDKMEQLRGIDPILLSDADNLSEAELEVDGIYYSRVTDITINADGSRTINIAVATENSSKEMDYSISQVIALWGSI